MASMTEEEKKDEAKLYEAIGRYAVAYELFVHELREGCLLFLCPNLDDEGNRQAQRLAEVPLHSKFMRAEALMEVFRTVVGEIGVQKWLIGTHWRPASSAIDDVG